MGNKSKLNVFTLQLSQGRKIYWLKMDGWELTFLMYQSNLFVGQYIQASNIYN